MKISKSSCDWTFHPWISRLIESQETLKTQILKNILSIFRDWGIDPPLSREKSVCAHDWDMQLDQLVTKSPKQYNTVFEIFDIFAKQKTF